MKRKLKRLQPGHNGFQFITEHSAREELSPLAFFDAGTHQRTDNGLKIGMHPHSGIGIITYFEGADLIHDDTGGNTNVVPSGGVQWISAGSGIWHDENYSKVAGSPNAWPLTIHQLWLQLPPALEESDPKYLNLQPAQIPSIGNIKLIAGSFQGQVSPLKTPYEMTYLDVSLGAGEHFELMTPSGQTKGLIFPREGEIELWNEPIHRKTIGILEENEGVLRITADADAKFVLILSESLESPIIARHGSIHSNDQALTRSLQNVIKIGKEQLFI